LYDEEERKKFWGIGLRRKKITVSRRRGVVGDHVHIAGFKIISAKERRRKGEIIRVTES